MLKSTRLQINAVWAITALTLISITILILVHFKPASCTDRYVATIPGVGTFPAEWAVVMIAVGGIVFCAKVLVGTQEPGNGNGHGNSEPKRNT